MKQEGSNNIAYLSMTTGDDNTIDIAQDGDSNTVGDSLVADIQGDDNDIAIKQKRR